MKDKKCYLCEHWKAWGGVEIDRENHMFGYCDSKKSKIHDKQTVARNRKACSQFSHYQSEVSD